MLPALVASVVADAARPEMSLAAGCDSDGTPDVEIELIHWCATAPIASMPPSDERPGDGSRAAPSVPEVMLPALVVSVVADGARPVISAAEGWDSSGMPPVVIS